MRIAAGARRRAERRARSGAASASASDEPARREQRGRGAASARSPREPDPLAGVERVGVELRVQALDRLQRDAGLVRDRRQRVAASGPCRRGGLVFFADLPRRRLSSASPAACCRCRVDERLVVEQRVVDDGEHRHHAADQGDGASQRPRLRVTIDHGLAEHTARRQRGRSRQRPCQRAQSLGLGTRGLRRLAAVLLVGADDPARGGDEAAGPAGREGGREVLTRPPCAPMPGSRNGARGISSRRRTRCSGTVAPVTAPTSAGRRRAPASPSPATIRATRSHTRSPPRWRGPATSAAPGFEVRTRTNRPGARARASELERVGAQVRVDGHGVGTEALDFAERRGRGAEERLGVGGGGDVDVAALGIGEHEQAAARARARRRVRARSSRAAPRRSKQASCGLTATHAGPAASMAAAQWAATAAAARSAGPVRVAAALASGHSFAGSGSSPRTICDSRDATAAASRSPKCTPADASRCCVSRALSAYA